MLQKLSSLGLRRVLDMGCSGSGQFSMPVASVRDGNLEWRNSGIFVEYLDLVPFRWQLTTDTGNFPP
jgi:hypothetical protein